MSSLSRMVGIAGATVLVAVDLAVGLGVTVVQVVGLVAGWWWVSVPAGLAAGVVLRSGWGVALVAASALFAWGGVLLWQSGAAVSRAGDVLGAFAFNTGDLGVLIAIGTTLYGAVLAVSGYWLGRLAPSPLTPRRKPAMVRDAPQVWTETSERPLDVAVSSKHEKNEEKV